MAVPEPAWRRRLRQGGGLLCSAGFFALGLALAYLIVEPKLIYYGHGEYLWYPILVPGLSDAAEITDAPGGALAYLAARLAYLYHSAWAGALVIAVTAWLLSVLTGALSSPGGGRWLRRLRFLPGILLLIQYGRYHPYLADAFAVLFNLLLAGLYLRLPVRGAGLRLALFAGLAAVSYWAAAPAFLVFVTLGVILDGLPRGRLGLASLLLPAIALPIPWVVGASLYELGPIQAFAATLPAHPEAVAGSVLTAVLMLCVPALALGSVLRQRRLEAGSQCGLGPDSLPPPASAHEEAGVGTWLATLALIGATAGAVLATADTGTRAVLRVNYYARQGRWRELLEASRRVPPDRYSIYVNCDVNRALYHTGRLASDLFSYPQYGSSSLLLPGDEALPPVQLICRSVHQAEVLYELGLVNQAEHSAHEALEQAGYCPVAVQRLALVNLVKGRPEAAGVFLRALGRDRLYREWAQEYLTLAADSSRLAAFPEIQRQRALMLKGDLAGDATPLDLFRENPHNQMAFEYLMAYSLLEGQHAPVAHYLGYLDTFGYPEGAIPRHYEEAILLQELMTGTTTDLHGRTINPETTRRFESFLTRSRELGADPSTLLKALREEYGNTYYYYYMWLHSQGTQRPSGAAGAGPVDSAGARR